MPSVAWASLAGGKLYSQVISEALKRDQGKLLMHALTGKTPFKYEAWDKADVMDRPVGRMLSVASAAYERATDLLTQADCPLTAGETKALLTDLLALWRYGNVLGDILYDWHLLHKTDYSLRELGHEVHDARRHVRIIYGRVDRGSRHDMPDGISWTKPENVLERYILRLKDTFEHLCRFEAYVREIVGPATSAEVACASAEFPKEMCEEIIDLSMAAALKIESNFEARIFGD